MAKVILLSDLKACRAVQIIECTEARVTFRFPCLLLDPEQQAMVRAECSIMQDELLVDGAIISVSVGDGFVDPISQAQFGSILSNLVEMERTKTQLNVRRLESLKLPEALRESTGQIDRAIGEYVLRHDPTKVLEFLPEFLRLVTRSYLNHVNALTRPDLAVPSPSRDGGSAPAS